ncbi:MAG: FtsX-like permease family protein, partial [Methanomassiliicoccales archaeon]
GWKANPIGQVFDVSLVLRPTTILLAGLAVFGCAMMAMLISTARSSNAHHTVLLHLRRGVRLLPIVACSAGAAVLIFAFLTGDLGLIEVAASLLLVLAGLVSRLRGSVIYWSLACAGITVSWFEAAENGWFGPDLTFVPMVFIGSSLLVSMAMMVSDLIGRSEPVALAVHRRCAAGSASFYLSIKHLVREPERRTVVVISIAALFLITTLTSSFVGIARNNIDEQYGQSINGVDAVVMRSDLSSIETDIWGELNVTDGALWPSNITSMDPIFASSRPVVLYPEPSGNAHLRKTCNVIGIDGSLLDTVDMSLMTFDRTLFADEDQVWNALMVNDSYAIVDADLAIEYWEIMDDDGGTLGMGSRVQFMNDTGAWTNLTIVGITQQRFLHGIFVSSDLLTGFLSISSPSIYIVGFNEGLDVREQADLLREQIYGDGLVVIDVGSARHWIDLSLSEWSKMFDALLVVISSSLTAGLIAQLLQMVQMRDPETQVLRSIGMRARSRNGSMLLEMAIPACGGLVTGILVASMISYTTWESFLQGGGLSYHSVPLDLLIWNSIMLLAILLTAYVSMGQFQGKGRIAED